MEAHPAAKAFPLMSGVELEELVESIRNHGLREPITVFNGVLLDGRNRLKACELTNTDVRFEEWDGKGSPIDYIADKNLHRRHLSDKDLQILGVKLIPLYVEEAGARMRSTQFQNGVAPALADRREPVANGSKWSSVQAAKAVGVGARTLQKTKSVMENAPELYAKFESGEMSIDAAYEIMKGRRNGTATKRASVDSKSISALTKRIGHIHKSIECVNITSTREILRGMDDRRLEAIENKTAALVQWFQQFILLIDDEGRRRKANGHKSP